MIVNKEILRTKIIYKNDKYYPKLLREIKNPPTKLFVKGNIELLNKPCIAVVGSRNYSEYGKKMTKKFTNGLVNEGFSIVSGLALGIDKFAHEECINCGGKTIAVIACGFNKIYPKENINLYKNILKFGGCIITEYEPNVEAKKEYFPSRNRLISGLSLGTLVIEASYRSGTSITAKYCMKQNRKLFCIPNSIDNKNAIGTNNLIKKGANLVTKIEDITARIGKIHDKVKVENISKIKEEDILYGKELIIYKNLKDKPKSPDEIAVLTGFTISETNVVLSMLEIEGYIVKIATDKYKVKEKND